METIKRQWDAMIARGRIPVLEWTILDGDSLGYLSVDVSYSDKGIVFTLDMDGDCYFSGNVETDGNEHTFIFDECFTDLDYYLQEINQEIVEGFILPNNIEIWEE